MRTIRQVEWKGNGLALLPRAGGAALPPVNARLEAIQALIPLGLRAVEFGGGAGSGGPGGGPSGGSSGGGAPSGQGEPKSVWSCAADFADTYSLAGLAHAVGVGNNGGPIGFLTEALGGNAISGAYHFFTNHPTSNSGLAQEWEKAAVAGPFLGLNPAATGWGQGVADKATEGLVKVAWDGINGGSELAAVAPGVAEMSTVTAAQVAPGVGLAKFFYDAATFALGYGVCSLK